MGTCMCKHLISIIRRHKVNIPFQHSFCPSALLCVHFYFTHYDTVFANMDIGTDLRCVDHTVLLDEDMVSNVQWEERHAGRNQEEKVIKLICVMLLAASRFERN